MRVIFAVAELLSADAIVTLDPNVTSVTPDWIPALAAPVRDGHADLVAPRYPRAAADGPLVTQLVRPLVRAAYGWTLSEPLMGEFGCSRAFATHCLERPAPEPRRDGVDCGWPPGAGQRVPSRTGSARPAPARNLDGSGPRCQTSSSR